MDNENDSNPKTVEDAVFGSDSGDYFDALDKEVNGVVRDPGQEEPNEQTTQEVISDPVVEAPQDNTDWKKRYSDSSAEAQRLAAENRELSQMKPLMNLMRQDKGLVDTIRTHLSGGGKAPTSIKDELKLDEDFVYDAHEAVTSPESTSAKVFDTMVDKAVNKKVSHLMAQEKAQAEQRVQKMNAQQQAEDFKKRHNMSDNDFNALMNKAKATKFTLDDVYHVLNKERVSEGVANSTKKDMLSQMQNVRDIPTSEAGVNSAPKGEEKPDDKVFDAILGLDGTFDELFG